MPVEAGHCRGVPGFGRLAVPVNGLHLVLLHPPPPREHGAERVHAGGVAGPGGLAEPANGRGLVFRDGPALHERDGEVVHGRSVPGLGRLAVPPDRLGLVLRHSPALLEDPAQLAHRGGIQARRGPHFSPAERRNSRHREHQGGRQEARAPPPWPRERLEKSGPVPVPVLRPGRERSLDDPDEPARRIGARERLPPPRLDVVEDLEDGPARERGLPREALVEDRSEREDVGLWPRRPRVLHLLGRHVAVRPARPAAHRDGCALARARRL
jgi:hypothetical protein